MKALLCLLLCLVWIPACASSQPADSDAIQLRLKNYRIPVLGRGYALQVEVMNADGERMEEVNLKATANESLIQLANRLAERITQRLAIDTVVDTQDDDPAEPVRIYLTDGPKFAKLSVRQDSGSESNAQGGVLVIEKVDSR